MKGYCMLYETYLLFKLFSILQRIGLLMLNLRLLVYELESFFDLLKDRQLLFELLKDILTQITS